VKHVKNGKIGVVITAWKEPYRAIWKAITSARGQDYKNCEVVVVWDGEGSKERDGADLLKRSMGTLAGIYTKPYSGRAATVNFGVEKLGEVTFQRTGTGAAALHSVCSVDTFRQVGRDGRAVPGSG
jgi:hypothetical protein